jgi:hypothetical protein
VHTDSGDVSAERKASTGLAGVFEVNILVKQASTALTPVRSGQWLLYDSEQVLPLMQCRKCTSEMF